eukprot:CFRG6158T1
MDPMDPVVWCDEWTMENKILCEPADEESIAETHVLKQTPATYLDSYNGYGTSDIRGYRGGRGRVGKRIFPCAAKRRAACQNKKPQSVVLQSNLHQLGISNAKEQNGLFFLTNSCYPYQCRSQQLMSAPEAINHGYRTSPAAVGVCSAKANYQSVRLLTAVVRS